MCSFSVVFTSSLEVADTIKTVDFSLPSYGDISDAKSSVGNTEGLTVEFDEGPTVKTKRTRAAAKAKSPEDDSGPDWSVVLPSMGKSVKKDQTVAKKEVVKEKTVTKKEATVQETEVVAKEAPKKPSKQVSSGSDSSAKQASTQKVAAPVVKESVPPAAPPAAPKPSKEEPKVAKERPSRKKAKEEKAVDFEVVDMGLPSYGDSTTTKDKGMFSI